MEHVAFFRNVNQGQRGHLTTADLLDAFHEAGVRDPFAFQSNGTVVFEAVSASDLIDEVTGQLRARGVFTDVVRVLPLSDIRHLVDLHGRRVDVGRYELTLFDPRRRLPEGAAVDAESLRRRCAVVDHGPGWAVIENERDHHSNGTPTIEAVLHAPATSRGLPTLGRLLRRIDSQP